MESSHGAKQGGLPALMRPEAETMQQVHLPGQSLALPAIRIKDEVDWAVTGLVLAVISRIALRTTDKKGQPCLVLQRDR